MKKVILLILLNCTLVSGYSQRKTLTENFLNNVGDSVVVTGKIYGGAFLTNVKTKPTFLNLGDTSPRHRLMIRIEPEDRDKFPSPPETFFLNKVVQVTGKLQEYKGFPLIHISEPGMIKTSFSTDTNALQTNVDLNSSRTGLGAVGVPATTAIIPSLKMIVPDSIIQTEWIKSVTERAAEEKRRNVRIVQKSMDLKTAPFNDAPIIAQLRPGMQVSVLYTSKKWSYISIGSVDGFNNVNGFIKHKRFRQLKKLLPK